MRDAGVGPNGSINIDFFSDQKEYLAQKRSPRGARDGHKPSRRGEGVGPRRAGLSPPRALSGLLPIFVFFQIFQNGENFLLEKFWSRFTYRITYLFVFGV